MSERKIISVNPPQQEPPKKQHPSRRRILIFVAIVLVVALVLGIVFLDEALNLDKVRRFFRYYSASDDENFGVYTFAAGNANAYAAFDDGLAVASQSGLATYATYGTEVGIAQASMNAPMVLASDGFAVGYDVGGNTIAMVDQSGQTICFQKTENTIFDLDVSEQGYVCYAMASDSYKAVLVTLNGKQQEFYRWNSNTQYFNCCAVSDDGECIAAVGLGQTDTRFSSTAMILRTDETEPHAQLALGNQVIYDLRFLNNGNLCAFGENSMIVFDLDGNQLGSFDYSGNTLMDFSTDGDWIALSLYKNMEGGSYEIVALDDSANVQQTKTLSKAVLSLSVCGKYAAVVTADELTIYNRALEIYSAAAEIGTVSKVIMRSDGTAILIGAGRGSLYIPA